MLVAKVALWNFNAKRVLQESKRQLHKKIGGKLTKKHQFPHHGVGFRRITAKMQVDGALVRHTHCLCNFPTTGCGFRWNKHPKMQRLHGKWQLHCKQMPFQTNTKRQFAHHGVGVWHTTAKIQVDGALVRHTHCLCIFPTTGWVFAKKNKAFRLALCELLTSTILSFLLRSLPAKSALRPT